MGASFNFDTSVPVASDANGKATIKALGGIVYGWNFINKSASNIFVAIKNTSAAPTVIGDCALIIQVPANSQAYAFNSNGILEMSSGIYLYVFTATDPTSMATPCVGAVLSVAAV